jgi:protein-tyrosine phosphatase
VLPQPQAEFSSYQRARLAQFGAVQSVDVHCHILPGVDDGPATLDETLALCRALVRDGITAVIATPHQLGRFEGRNLAADVRTRVDQLQAVLHQRRIPLQLSPGAEVRVDERIPSLLRADQILTLADKRKCLLLELPTSVAIDPEILLPHLEVMECRIVLAHSERYEALWRDPALAEEWVRRGAALQVNAGAVTGAFGAPAQRAAWFWLQRGWVWLIATDSHSVGVRRPRMSDAIQAIERECGAEIAKCVCIENPLCVWEGRDLLQPPVLPEPHHPATDSERPA